MTNNKMNSRKLKWQADAILNIDKSPSAKYQRRWTVTEKEISTVAHNRCTEQSKWTHRMRLSTAAQLMLLLLTCLKTGSETENDICRAGGSGCLLPVVRRMMTSFLAEVYDGVIEWRTTSSAASTSLVSP